jgi:branched-chain amino acid transport system substrate-binding protein
MRASIALPVVGSVALLAASCGGSTSRPFLIGLLSDCYGPFGGAHELNLAAAELPLIERGAKPRARKPSAGISPVDVAGQRVELRVGCVANSEDVIPAARQLIEEDDARAVIGPLDPSEGMALLQYARIRPDAVFLIQPSAAPEVTLDRPARNVFRFAPDAAQTSAGLGAYAFRRLGWRTAAVVGDNVPYAWEEAAGFIAEFCSLGGRIVAREWIPPLNDSGAAAPRVPPSADGVYLGAAITPMQPFLVRYARLRHGLAGKLVSGLALFGDLHAAASAVGAVVAGTPPVEPTREGRAFAVRFAHAFPGLPAAAAANSLSLGYKNGVDAVLLALEHSQSASTFRAALGRVALDSPLGPMRLDRNRQAITTNYVSKVSAAGTGVAIRTIRVVSRVHQTFGGYFTPAGPSASETTPACVKRVPPPWAR